MAVLLDTNILLRLSQPNHPSNPIAEQALLILRRRGELLHIASQNLVEFWAVATCPLTENGLGLGVEQAATEIAFLKRLFVLLPEAPLQIEWERLVTTFRVSGKNSHDARLVAAMMVHGIGHILTFNATDFVRYSSVSVITPAAVT